MGLLSLGKAISFFSPGSESLAVGVAESLGESDISCLWGMDGLKGRLVLAVGKPSLRFKGGQTSSRWLLEVVGFPAECFCDEGGLG